MTTKRGVPVFILLLLVFCQAAAQDVDTTFKSRNIRQQLFVMDYLKANELAAPVSAPEEIDSYFRKLTESWGERVSGEDPHLAKFNPYVYIWTLHSLMGTDAPQWANCHVYREYMVPAFLADFDKYRAEVRPKNAFLIRWGIDWMGIPLAVNCELSLEQWERLYSALRAAPNLITQYLENGAYADDNVKRQLEQSRGDVQTALPYLAIQNKLYESDLDAAFADLAAAFVEARTVRYLIPLGRELRERYESADEKAHALASLDLLGRSTTTADLPRDSLRAWYEEVDPERGRERFSQMTGDSSLPVLVASGERVNLAGQFPNLLTGEPFDLAGLEGKLVLFDFWATWCSPCIAEIPKLQKLVAEYGNHFTFVSVSSDGVTGGEDTVGVRTFMEQHGINYTVLYDDPANPLSEQFDVNGWPAKFLIDESGELMKHPTERRTRVTIEDVREYLASL